MNGKVLFLVVCVAGFVAGVHQACADTIELTTGQKIEGEILKVQADAIYVDVGVDVVRIPVDRIKSRVGGDEPAEKPKETAGEIFSTAKLPEKTGSGGTSG